MVAHHCTTTWHTPLAPATWHSFAFGHVIVLGIAHGGGNLTLRAAVGQGQWWGSGWAQQAARGVGGHWQHR